ncbi:MAG TPA: bifunctional precorrin-2 dehydrogenase/sirohydrochlorin ferrochelatase [Candidatus Binataceae bacterium]|nr:bifunctional precorrin-2 dehydrogenase/sirohydrochlorin ferrochelatase [Candidatus Binataceae bacterium]
MAYLPIYLDLGGRRCVVVGGGAVAEQKARTLLDAGAEVTVVSPLVTGGLEELAAAGRVTRVARKYRHGDLGGFMLAYVATGDAQLNREIAGEARERGVLLNVADAPELCSFIAPAVMKRGELQIAISTGGASPAFASRLRRELEGRYGAEYAMALAILRAARRHLRATESEPAERSRKLRALAASELPECIRCGEVGALDALLARHLGAGLEALGLKMPDLPPAGRDHASR